MCEHKLQFIVSWIILGLTLMSGSLKADITACSTDDTDCDCSSSQGNGYKMVCDRTELVRIPKLTSIVMQLDMFRTTLVETTVRSDSLWEATSLRIIRLESCELLSIDVDAFKGLYSLQELNLAYNNIRTLARGVFADLNPLQNLDLSYNSLENLSPDVFLGLSNLNTLDLSYNSLESVPENLLKHLPSLKTLRLENSLMSTAVLPELFLSHTPQLESLNLNDNKLTQLQRRLLESTRSLRELSLRGNEIVSIESEVFQGLTQLTTLELEDNPFSCDCSLVGYRLWVDEKALASWSPDKTGRCNTPQNLQGQYISSIPLDQFTCPPTTTTSTRIVTNPPSVESTDNGRETETSLRGTSTTIRKTRVSTVNIVSKPIELVTDEPLSKSLERSIIIGCSVGGAFLLFLINVLIIFCVWRAKRHTGMRKIKYIIRPDALQETKDVEDGRPYEKPTVNGTGPSYIISNGISGFYHTGSRSRLYGPDLDQSLYDSAPAIPPKQKHLLDQHGEKTPNHDLSIFSIPMPPEDSSKYVSHQDNLAGSYYVPNIKYTDNWQTPVTANHKSVSFKSTNQWKDELEPHNVDDEYEFDPMIDHNPGNYSHNPYYTSSSYLDIDQCTDNHSQEFIPDIKYSTGSADSGVHSNSPYLGISDSNMSPALPHRHRDEHLMSIHELNESHISIGSRKVRNETYV